MFEDDDIKFIFLGWNKSDKSDKIWGIFKAGGRYYSFWGKRGKKLQFKEEHYPKNSYGVSSPFGRFKGGQLLNLGLKGTDYFISEKIKRGYVDYTENADDVYENCFNYLTNELLIAKICEKIRKKNNS
ncbi:MAG: hypothetical protein CO106_03120 [Deltaproteobacteria bacterium CG_4_9_14_3_um_filter_44_9]|nr:MAG: hypothetical protein CO106_03120 [Deltaproteobacteria bacterium CG_4_9_14_3_um_filter_44_9]